MLADSFLVVRLLREFTTPRFVAACRSAALRLDATSTEIASHPGIIAHHRKEKHTDDDSSRHELPIYICLNRRRQLKSHSNMIVSVVPV